MPILGLTIVAVIGVLMVPSSSIFRSVPHNTWWGWVLQNRMGEGGKLSVTTTKRERGRVCVLSFGHIEGEGHNRFEVATLARLKRAQKVHKKFYPVSRGGHK